MDGKVAISDTEFKLFQRLLFKHTGISLSDHKATLVESRLTKRLFVRGLNSFYAYYTLIIRKSEQAELQEAINRLTTNETYFFRESAQLEFFKTQVIPKHVGKNLSVWSAACSSGEEVYSLAMLLYEGLGAPHNFINHQSGWSILGSDISTQVLGVAQSGLYSLEQAERIPDNYLKRFCLKGTDEYSSKMLMVKALRQAVEFQQINLIDDFYFDSKFDCIFLRNLLIYFDAETKRTIVGKLTKQLKNNGWLFLGHAESLHGLSDQFRSISPSIYQKQGPQVGAVSSA